MTLKSSDFDRTLSEEALRIYKIANTPDDVLDLFKDTFIYDFLLQRRALAREYKEKIITEDDTTYFNLIEQQIKSMLSLT